MKILAFLILAAGIIMTILLHTGYIGWAVILVGIVFALFVNKKEKAAAQALLVRSPRSKSTGPVYR